MNEIDNQKIRIVIFGAGDFGLKVHDYYRETHEIMAFVDSDPGKCGMSLRGTRVHLPKDLSALKWDQIFVASGHADEIETLLAVDYGIRGDAVVKVPISVLHNEMTYGIDDLVDLVHRLEQMSVSYWLDHSSLLGLIRDDEPASKDVDLAVSLADYPALMCVLNSYLEPEQICVYRYGFDSDLWGCDDVRQIKLFGYLDIHLKIKCDQDYFWLVGPMLLKAASSYYDGCDTRAWGDVALRVPRQPENYLRMLYGAWEMPAESWSYSDYRNIARVFHLEEMQGGIT